MSGLSTFLSSTIGRKQLVGLAGLLLCLFILSHMLGNLLIFVGPEAYNMYGHKLTSNPLIYIAEAGLIAFFLCHIVLALILTLKNHAARPTKYAVSAGGEKKTTLVQKTMWYQGIIIFGFVVLHLITFKFGTLYTVNYEGQEVRDLFRLVVEVFQSPVYVVGYVISLVLLGLHVGHGFSSSIQTLGFNHPKYTPKIEMAGTAYSVLVTLGFIAQPVYVFFVH